MIARKRSVFYIFLFFLLLDGCSFKMKVPKPSAEKKVKKATSSGEKIKKNVSTPKVSKKLPKELPVLSDRKRYKKRDRNKRSPQRSTSASLPLKPEKRYFLRVRDAEIEEVLLSFSKDTTLNFIIESDIKGQITVDLKNVTLSEALDSILSPLDMRYSKKGNFIHVFKDKMITRMFTLSYITTTRSGNTSVSFGSGGGSGTASLSDNSKYDIWKSLKSGINAVLTEGAWSMIDVDSGIIMIHDFPSVINQVSEYLKIVEGSINRQVSIETRIIEVTLNDKLSTGIDWSHLPISLDGIRGTLPGGAIAKQSTQITTGAFQFGIADSSTQVFIQALRTYGKINILSKPRIAVLNNQKAGIMSSTEEIYYTKSVRKTEFGTDIEFKPNKIRIGVALDITPQIDSDRNVTILVHPSISEKTGESTTPDGELTTPLLNLIEASTVLKVKDGQTIIIGGLIKERETISRQSVPILGSIPFFGRLFRSDVKENVKTEMVIMITPTILNGIRIDEAAKNQLERLNTLREQ